jgi:GTP-binding protein
MADTQRGHPDTVRAKKDAAHTQKNPVVVVAGRPNVGKSTLVNRIVGKRAAIVEEHPGVTRDRNELEADWRGYTFTIVDTGGVTERGSSLDVLVAGQALRAVGEADVILFVIDAVTGPTAEDEAVGAMLRKSAHKVVLVANKVDSSAAEGTLWDSLRLGFGDPVPISALHGRGVGDMLDTMVGHFAPRFDTMDADSPADEPIAGIAIIGRPNVGKSTLFNRLVGDERSVVHDVPGTTRDAIDTVVETPDGLLRFIDTAGLRRAARIEEGSEYYSLVRSLSTIDRADVALLVIDATEGVTHQDQRLAERIDASGSPVVIVLNKWELLDTEGRLRVSTDIEDRLAFLGYAPVLRISAKTGLGVNRILPAITSALDAYHRRIPTAQLNEAMQAIQQAHPAARGRILYAVQGAIDPPTMTLFASQRLTSSYLRFVERSLRERFALGPTALKLRVRLRGER